MKLVSVAKALLLDADGNVLILRRSPTHPTLAGHPDLPGGLIDPGEEPGEALVREILEETGLKITVSDLHLLYGGTEAYKGESRVRLLFSCRLSRVKPTIAISWEHDHAAWQPMKALPKIEEEFHTFYRDALEYVHRYKLLEN